MENPKNSDLFPRNYERISEQLLKISVNLKNIILKYFRYVLEKIVKELQYNYYCLKL